MNYPHPRSTKGIRGSVPAGALLALLLSITCSAVAGTAEKLSDSALHQIGALQQEKLARSPLHRKLDSQFVFQLKQNRGQVIAQGVTKLQPGIKFEADGRVLVDIGANVTEAVLAQIKQGGGTVINSFPQFHAIRALVTLDQLESLAGSADVKFIRRAAQAHTNTGSVTSEGDVTHRANIARSTIGMDGRGVKVGVLSDSVDHLADSQASGDLGDVTVLPGQSGSGSGEGTAMLEIIHDLAPGAQLYFATAFNGEASFAQNILNLRSNGCDIIVDDVYYFDEPPFQDGIIAQAVNSVTANGALYFSSAGNDGNVKNSTSGTWEGDFVDGGLAGPPVNNGGGILHSFGTTTFNTVIAPGYGVDLFWADPLGASTNDYDLFVLDSTGTDVVASSLNLQDGTQDPYESALVYSGERVVIVKATGDARFLHLVTSRGRLSINTGGAIRGHAAAAAAFGVAAVDAATSYPNPFGGGGQNPVEYFSSDGPRRVFFHADGTPVTPGDYSSTGGSVRQKPDLAAADGVMTSLYSFRPFYGTSAAAPHAAAIAALLWSYHHGLGTDQIRTALTSAALDIEAPGSDPNSGDGLVMAYEALRALPPLPYVLAGGWALVNEYCPNGAVDPGETVTVALALTNSGTASTSNLVANLLNSGGISFPSGPQSYGPLAPGGGPTDRLFTFTATGSCGGTNVATLQLQDGTNDLGTVSFALPLGNQRIVLTQNFDTATPPALPPGWTSSGTGTPWRTTNRLSDTPPNSAFVPDPDAVSDKSMFSPSLFINTTSARLTFRHSYDAQSYYDGGVLEISMNGGAYTDIITAGGSFAANGYDASLDSGTDNPIQGRQAWSGNSGGFVTTVVNLPAAAAGKNIRLRWRFGSDWGYGIDGWYVDTISLSDGFECCSTVANDLVLSIANSPDPVVVGGSLTYTININNTGPAPAAGVSLTDVLPASFTLQSITFSRGVYPGPQANGGGTLTFNLDTLPGGGSATIVLGGTVDSLGLITNRVTISRTDPDANPANNVATAVTAVVLPALSINDVSLMEGNSGTTNAVFTVTLWPPPIFTATVNFATANSTAVAGSDYVATTGTLVFALGVTNRTIAVPVIGDTLNEANETFTVNLSNPTNAVLAGSQGLGTILNDDPLPNLSVSDVTLVKPDSGTTNAVFNIRLSVPSGQTVSVYYYTSDGTAMAGSDYVPLGSTLTFTPGQTAKTVPVVVNGHATTKPAQTFCLNLDGYSVINAKLAHNPGLGTILTALPGQVDHFVWNAIPSPQSNGAPFAVTIAAQDYWNSTVSNFNGAVALGGWYGTLVSPSITSILLFDDAQDHYFQSALNALGLSYQTFSIATEAAFNTTVTTANPNTTLVVVDAANYPHDFSAVVAFVNAGGRAVFEYWDLDTSPSVAAAFNARVAADMLTPAPVYDWGGSLLFAGLPNPVNFVKTFWNDDGDRLNPIAGGTAVGGFVSSPTSDQAALIVGNSGRTILNGFLLDDAQSSADALLLAKNEIATALHALSLVTTPLVIVPSSTTSFSNGVWSGNVTVPLPATNVTLRADDGLGHFGQSLPFDVMPAPGQVTHFVWSPIPSLQSNGAPFAVALTAQDCFNDTATNFTGTVALSGSGVVGTRTNTVLGAPTHTDFGSGAFTLGYSFTPRTNLTVTHVRHYFGTVVKIWTDAGVLLGGRNVSSTPGTWRETALFTPIQLLAGQRYRIGVYGTGNDFIRYDLPGTFPDGTIDQSYNISGNAFPSNPDSTRWYFVDLRYTVGIPRPVPVSPANSGNFVGGMWSGNLAVFQAASNVTLRADDGLGHVGQSLPFDVAQTPGQVTHFVWSPISSPQLIGEPFAVTITARDYLNTTATNFIGPVGLGGLTNGLGDIMIEDFESGIWPHAPWVPGSPAGSVSPDNAHDGSFGLTDPEWTYRTDVQIGNAGDILSWWIRPSSSSNARAYCGFAASVSGCWSVVAAPNTSQFMIQKNAGYGYAELVTASQTWQPGRWYKIAVRFNSTSSVTCNLYDSDGATILNSLSYGGVTGLPAGVAMRSFGGFSWDTIGTRVSVSGPISVSPTNSGSFTDGVWSGSVAVLLPATNVTLLAADGLGHLGQSLPFSVAGTPKLSIALSGDSVVLSWPAALSGFTLEQMALMPSQTNWVPVPDAPVVVGDRNTVTNLLTKPGVLYRLRGS